MTVYSDVIPSVNRNRKTSEGEGGIPNDGIDEGRQLGIR